MYADTALTEAFTKIGQDFEATQGIKVKFVFGAGSALEKQLGADVDVFASASPDTAKPESKVFAVNRLVLAVPQGNPKNVTLSPRWNPQTSFAMCVEEAPCGAAAKPALQNAGLPAPKAVGQDTRETLAKLTAGEVDSAFVYATDAKPSLGLFAVPVRPGLGFPITMVSGSPEAKKFYDFVFGEQARAALTDAGFELP